MYVFAIDTKIPGYNRVSRCYFFFFFFAIFDHNNIMYKGAYIVWCLTHPIVDLHNLFLFHYRVS